MTNEEAERLKTILDVVEHPCVSKDVGAPGSLMRRANDLGRELADLRKLKNTEDALPFESGQVVGFEEPILRFFSYKHLPPTLAEVSRPFCDLAAHVVATLPRSAERTVTLRKLLEAKDAAVRASLPEEP